MSDSTSADLSRACIEHEAYLRARLRGLGVGEANLDDAVQDVFEVLVRRLGDYDSRFSLRQWMAGVARRVARRYRERAFRAPAPLDEAQLTSGEPDPERWTSRQEAAAVLRTFLGQLDADRWAVFVLSEIEGLRGTEIAAELDVNLSTVYARLRAAKQAFDRALAQHRRGERRSWLALPWFTASPGRPVGAAAFVTPVLLVTLGAAGLGGVLAARSCGESVDARVVAAERHADEPVAAENGGVRAREADPPTIAAAVATASVTSSEPTGWIELGHGHHEGARHFYDEPRFRIDGGDVVLEVEYIGDDDIPTVGLAGWIEPDGFTIVEGSDQWPLDLAAGERRVVGLRLRAVREGVVAFALRDGDPERTHGSGSDMRLIHERGRLRRCGPDECLRTVHSLGDMLSGTRINVALHNACDRAIDVVMLPIELDRPPPGAPELRLAVGEKRRVAVDTALGFGRRTDDDRVSDRVHTDTEGALVRFSGENCQVVGTFDPSLPPALGGP